MRSLHVGLWSSEPRDSRPRVGDHGSRTALGCRCRGANCASRSSVVPTSMPVRSAGAGEPDSKMVHALVEGRGPAAAGLVALVGLLSAAEPCMITLCMRCWLWARKRLVRPGPACVQPSWGVFVRGNLPREAVGRTLGGHEPAKTPLLSPACRRDVVRGRVRRAVTLARGWR